MAKQHFDKDCLGCEIRQNGLFGGLCSTDLGHLSTNKTSNLYRKGQVLFHEGTRPMGVFCVYGGKVKIYKLGRDGKEQITKIVKQSDLLGYKALISEETYPVSAETLEDSNICFIPKTDFLEVLHSSEELHDRVLKAVCHELGVMSERMTDLAQKSVRERLALSLLMLKDTYGLDATDNGRVEINLTREDMANIVGTATETLIRLLHDFKEEKLISTKGRKIAIENSQGLAQAAGLL